MKLKLLAKEILLMFEEGRGLQPKEHHPHTLNCCGRSMLWGCFIVTGAVNLIKMEGIMRKEGYGKVLTENLKQSAAKWLSAVASDTTRTQSIRRPW